MTTFSDNSSVDEQVENVYAQAASLFASGTVVDISHEYDRGVVQLTTKLLGMDNSDMGEVASVISEHAANAGHYYWTGWEVEAEETEDGREGVHYITIYNQHGEEYAVIIHRVSAAFPLDGWVAQDKIKRAQAMVDALNATL